METTTAPSTTRIALKYGLYAGLASIIYSAILNITGLAFNQTVGYLSIPVGIIISVLAIVYACKEFREGNGGALSLGQAIGIGTLLSVVSGFLSGLFTTIYVKIIDTSYAEKLIDNSRRQLEEQGNMSDEQIDQAIEISRPITEGMLNFSFITGPIMGAIFGVILSLIIGAIMKKDRDVFAQ
jgi:hypothetical protein